MKVNTVQVQTVAALLHISSERAEQIPADLLVIIAHALSEAFDAGYVAAGGSIIPDDVGKERASGNGS
jgi:hypothetical protein